MGNRLVSHPSSSLQMPSNIPESLFSPQSQQNFIIKKILTQSPEQHQELIADISKYKQEQHPNMVRLIDLHTVESHNLCSVLSHLFIIMEKPVFTLEDYHEKLKKQGKVMQNHQISDVLAGCCRGIEYLRKYGHDFTHLDESLIYIDEQANGSVVPKIINPSFVDEVYEESNEETIEVQLATIMRQYVSSSTSSELVGIIELLGRDQISLRKVEEVLGDEKVERKGRSGIRRVKEYQRQERQQRKERPSVTSMCSNSSSLMIDAGDVSDLMFKDFYQHFDDSLSLSQISLSNTENETNEDHSHQFPKKYLKTKGFKKMNKTVTSSNCIEFKSLTCSTIKRPQFPSKPDKENISLQSSKSYFLSSTKLAQSYIGK